MKHKGFRSNWSNSFSYHPRHVHRPRSREEVVELVQRVADDRGKLYPVGSLHSWGYDLAENDAFAFIDTSLLDRIHSFDAATLEVDVDAGSKLRPVNAFLLKQDPPCALQGTGSTQKQSLAGAMSNSLNPYGGDWSTFSHYVSEVELVDGRGNVRSLTDRDGDYMRAARVSLGLLGVITRVKLKVGRSYIAVRTYDKLTKEQFLQDVHAVIGNEERVQKEFIFYPDVDEYGVSIIRPATEDEKQGFDSEKHRDFKESRLVPLMQDCLLRPLLEYSRTASHKWRTIGPAVYTWTTLNDKVNHLNHIFENEMGHFVMSEYYIPLRLFPKLIEDFPRMYRIINDDYIQAGFKFRPFRQIDNTLVSPMSDEKHVSILYSTLVKSKYKRAFMEMENYLVNEFEARMHWGTEHVQKSKHLFKALYGDAFDRFVSIRRELDPHNIFMREPSMLAFA